MLKINMIEEKDGKESKRIKKEKGIDNRKERVRDVEEKL